MSFNRHWDPFHPVIVEWEDACGQLDVSAETVDEATFDYEPMIRRTIGFFVGFVQKHGREALIITSDDDRAERHPERMGGVICIPTGMILEIHDVS